MKNKYKIAKTLPLAKFWYRGNHSHPVKRTILLTKNEPNTITGYEIREGAVIRRPQDAPVKSYRKDKIAKYRDLRKESRKNSTSLTLKRFEITELIQNGF